MTLLASFIFAVLIVLLDRLGRQVRPGHLTVGFLTATGLPALVLANVFSAFATSGASWPRWTAFMLAAPANARDIVMSVVCTVLAFHWMTTYQPQVSASRAALIYLLEPVFASLFSVLWQHDKVTERLIAGGALIITGNFLVEVPLWLKRQPASGKCKTPVSEDSQFQA
jgi:drug/metabolite transporter (DMT)-like permease